MGRADNPAGPFYDFSGKDLKMLQDHTPMVLAPYAFSGHGGWQGTGHCAVFSDNDQYFMAHQGRPGVNKFYMVLHVRKIFWTADGWPVVSPERYAWNDNSAVPQDSIPGAWKRIALHYSVVPGYSAEQISPDMQVAASATLAANGTVTGASPGMWTYAAPWLTVTWNTGATDKVYVQKGYDWENKRKTIVFTGLDNTGVAVWGKKK